MATLGINNYTEFFEFYITQEILQSAVWHFTDGLEKRDDPQIKFTLPGVSAAYVSMTNDSPILVAYNYLVTEAMGKGDFSMTPKQFSLTQVSSSAIEDTYQLSAITNASVNTNWRNFALSLSGDATFADATQATVVSPSGQYAEFVVKKASPTSNYTPSGDKFYVATWFGRTTDGKASADHVQDHAFIIHDKEAYAYLGLMAQASIAEKVSVSVSKEWVNGPAQHPNIQVQLYQNGLEYGSAIELSDGLIAHTWTDLDKSDSNGTVYEYTVDEVNVPAGYDKTVEFVGDGWLITNSYIIEKIDLKATKRWVNSDGAPLAIQLQMYRNGEAYQETVALAAGDTTYTWVDLNKTDLHGNAYVYTIDEIDVPSGYVKDVDNETLTITNTRLSGMLPATGVYGNDPMIAMLLVILGSLMIALNAVWVLKHKNEKSF